MRISNRVYTVEREKKLGEPQTIEFGPEYGVGPRKVYPRVFPEMSFLKTHPALIGARIERFPGVSEYWPDAVPPGPVLDSLFEKSKFVRAHRKAFAPLEGTA